LISSQHSQQEPIMPRRQSIGARNKLDLTDRVQVRIVRKRLKVTDEQLARLVETAGNSIAAVNKEATVKRRLSLPASPIPPLK
jgi:DNA-binding XRE family transcriptional regulator